MVTKQLRGNGEEYAVCSATNSLLMTAFNSSKEQGSLFKAGLT